jgi:hypothetical protein
MSGTEEPSARELESNLVRRILSVREAEVAKRFNRGGVGRTSKRFDRHGIHGFYSFKDLEGVDGLDSIISPSNVTSGNGTGSSAATSADPAIGGSPGAPAAAAPNLTPANKPTAPNSLGLDIEYVVPFSQFTRTYLICSGVKMSGTLQLSRSVLHQGTFQFSWTLVPQISGLVLRTVNLQMAVVYVVYLTVPSYVLILTLALNSQGNHQFLGPASSTSFAVSTTQFQVQYGTGAVAGSLVRDNVNIAGLQLNAHIFGTASQETDDFSGDSTSFDGLMGLAQSVRYPITPFILL